MIDSIIPGDSDFIPYILTGWAASGRITAAADRIDSNFLRIRKAVQAALEVSAASPASLQFLEFPHVCIIIAQQLITIL